MRLIRSVAVCLALSIIAASTALAADSLPAEVAEVRRQIGDDNLDAAVDAAEQATDTLPDDARSWFWAGRAYGLQAMRASLLGKPKWAGRSRDAYEKAVALDPALLEARYDLMQYYLFAPGILGGGRDKADAQAQELARQDLVWGKLAQSALAMNDKQPEKAEAVLREALVAVPQSNRARLALSGLLQRQTRWDDVRSLWRDRIGSAPEDALARYQLGRAAALSGSELEDGLAQLDAFLAAAVYPENLTPGAAHWRRGQVLEKLGRKPEALAALRLAVADPSTRRQAEADLKRVEKSG